MASRKKADRRRLRARALDRIRDAGDRDRAVEAGLQRRSPFRPEQILSAALERDLADRVEDIAVRRFQVETGVAIRKLERPIVDGGGRGDPPVQRQRPAQIEEPQRGERAAHPPALDCSHGPPGLELHPGVARRRRAPRGDPRRSLPHESRGPRRHGWPQRVGRSGDELVDLWRFPFQIEQAQRGKLRDRVRRSRLQRRDEMPRRGAGIGSIFGDLAQARERKRAIGRRSGARRRLQLRHRPLRIRGDQVAQPPGPGEQRWVALRCRLNLLKLSRRVLGVEAWDCVAAATEGAARQEQGREHTLPHQRAAVCASGVASTRRCSASSSRPRNARNAA